MKKHIVAMIFTGLIGVVVLASAACDTNTPVPPTPLVSPTSIALPTATAMATQIVAVAPPTAVKNAWQLFASADGRFAVDMPGKPVEGTQPIENTLGNLTLHSFAAVDGDITYTLFYVDFPDAAKGANPTDLLNAALMRVGGSNTITDQKKIDVQGNPGVEVEGENGDKGYMRYKAVLVKTRLYELIVLSSNKDGSAQEATHFLESLKLNSQ